MTITYELPLSLRTVDESALNKLNTDLAEESFPALKPYGVSFAQLVIGVSMVEHIVAVLAFSDNFLRSYGLCRISVT